MNSKQQIALILVLIGLCLIAVYLTKSPYVPAEQDSTTETAELTQFVDSEEDAISLVKQRIGIVDPEQLPYWVGTHCVNYIVSEFEPNYYLVEIRERHVEKDNCPGDPHTMPLIVSFRVQKDNGYIFKYDLVNDIYINY